MSIHLAIHLLQASYVSRATGTRAVPVECALCGRKFSYLLKRTAFASCSQLVSITDHEKKGTDARAQAWLQQRLAREFDPVPCPGCGDYQPEMAKQLKAGRWRGLLKYQKVLLSLGVVAALGSAFMAY